MNAPESSSNRLPLVAPVSVIIPCFRCADTVERALLSVLEQTLPPAEILLIDDCSQDETLSKLRRLSAEHGAERIKVIALAANAGAGSARNAGWDAASQAYLALLDADDAWHPRKLEMQYQCLLRHPDAALVGNRCVFFAGEYPERDLASRADWPGDWRKISRWGLLLSNRFHTSASVIRADLPFRFPGKRYSEDYGLWLDIVFAGYPAYVSDLPLAFRHKAAYGMAGLTRNLWWMEQGELANILGLIRRGKLAWLAGGLALAFSLLKFCRRYLVCLLRRAAM